LEKREMVEMVLIMCLPHRTPWSRGDHCPGCKRCFTFLSVNTNDLAGHGKCRPAFFDCRQRERAIR